MRPVDGWGVVERAAALARDGVEFAMATVVWRQGPSSGQQGSRALILASGELIGWIGGACAEPIVVREAQRAIVDREPRLLLLGTPDQFVNAVPDGMRVIPIACQSEGALEVYVEPVVPAPHLVVVGRSPMTEALVEMADLAGWRAQLVPGDGFAQYDVAPADIVVVATQGHGDEEAVEHAATAAPAFVGLVASRRRGEAVLGYLVDRGIPREVVDRIRVPVGLDLGHTSHREIAVAVLAELVELRAKGAFATAAPTQPAAAPAQEAVDPVCGMTVTAGNLAWEHAGTTYSFCSAGCRQTFQREHAHADHE